MTAIFRGAIESVKINKDTSQNDTLELIVSTFMITIEGKIQVIQRNPVRFFTDKESLVNKTGYNVGDTVKITVRQTDGEANVEEILCYAADKPSNQLDSAVITGSVISFREVLKISQPYELKRKPRT
jgi:hypothetical protein